MGCGGSKDETVADPAAVKETANHQPQAAKVQQQASPSPAAVPVPGSRPPAMPMPMMNPAELQSKLKARGAAAEAGAVVSSATQGKGGAEALLSRAKGAKGRRPRKALKSSALVTTGNSLSDSI
jgi:hypothetical protein